MTPSAWQPLQAPTRPAAEAGFGTSAFRRLARAHAAGTAGDAVVATALASSIFFTLEPTEARLSVIRYLLLTMLPFAVLSPLIGPLVDQLRSGHRYVLIATGAARALLCFFMIGDIADQSPFFFFEALGVLAMQKAYSVARSALVPTVVTSDAELVEANSKLQLISGIMGFVGAGPGLLLGLIGPEWPVALAMVVFTGMAVLASRVPATQVATERADRAERVELRSAGILLAASAMGLLRAIVGFLTLVLAFDFRGEDVPKSHFAVVVATSVLGGLAGAALAPRIRKVASEEQMLTGVLIATTAAAWLALGIGILQGAAILAATVGIAATTGKLAFDSIVQRDAPDANRGRSFARFETRFQVMWVVGAFVAVLLKLSATGGFLGVGVVAGFATFSYVVGQLATRHRRGDRSAATARAVRIERRMGAAQAAARARARTAGQRIGTRMPALRRSSAVRPRVTPPADGIDPALVPPDRAFPAPPFPAPPSSEDVTARMEAPADEPVADPPPFPPGPPQR